MTRSKVHIIRPELTETERRRRMERIKQSAAALIRAAEIKRRKP